MSSATTQVPATLEQAEAEAMPLPDSRPDSPTSINSETHFQVPEIVVRIDKPDGADTSIAEYNEMTATEDVMDDKCSIRSVSSETAPVSPIAEASAVEVVAPQIRISVVDSEDSASQRVEADSTETNIVTHDEPDEDNCKCISLLILQVFFSPRLLASTHEDANR